MHHARTIEEVIGTLTAIVATEGARDSRLALFPALYRLVTLRVRQDLLAGRFDDSARMERLVVAFAGRYFEAYDGYLAGTRISRCWRVAFEATESGETCILQDLLLGINAHINLDLGIAASEITRPVELAALRPDFMAINRILHGLLDDVQHSLGEFSPMLDVIDRVCGGGDELLGTFVMDRARDDAWDHACRLSWNGAVGRESYVDALDRSVSRLGSLIARPPSRLVERALELVRLTEYAKVSAVTGEFATIVKPIQRRVLATG